ncbi:S-layer homology domain-containing protein [Anaerobacillus alkaliphilus]|nr:S-layer homology domain-containing protein [Anaerobacillus alkaliphilus]
MRKYLYGFLITVIICGGLAFLSLTNNEEKVATAATIMESNQVAIYNDLQSVRWAESSIVSLTERGTISGIGAGAFGPTQKITRAQAATLLVRELYPHLLNNSSVKYTSEFKDIGNNHYFIREISIANEKGLMSGYSDGTFRPNQPISRTETAVILARPYIKLSGRKEVTFKDLHEANWAKGSIRQLASNNLIAGYSPERFGPNQAVTRAEFAVFLKRVIDFSPMQFNGVLSGTVPYSGNVVHVTTEEGIIPVELAGFEYASVADMEAGMTDIFDNYIRENFKNKAVRVEIEPSKNDYKLHYTIGYIWVKEGNEEILLNLALLKAEIPTRRSREFSSRYKYYDLVTNYR